jgi:hypothetical protein
MAAGRRTLPFGPARLVEVQVNVNQPWQDMQIGRRDLVRPTRSLRRNVDNATVVNDDVGLTPARGGHDGAAADDQIRHAHQG